jgi:hypothetical protein
MLLGLCAPVLHGCASPSNAPTLAAGAAPAQSSEPLGLLIQGYNYTDQYINSFTVNGQGGGNVFVSTPTSGGGGSACCFDVLASSLPVVLTIRWSAAYCMAHKDNPLSFGPRQVLERKTFWKEAQITLKDIQWPARALEVHFYKDGHIEAAITPGYSPPRLQLPVTADGQRSGAPDPHPLCSPS